MLLCVSLNPGVDKRLRLRQFRLGSVNRVIEASPAPGGKAAHVAMVLRTLGADPLWLGFMGGATGKDLIDGLHELSIRTEAIATASCTRTNLEIIEEEGGVTEILEPGQRVTPAEVQRLEESMTRLLAKATEPSTVIFSGSLPTGVPSDYYRTLVALAHRSESQVFVDTSGEPFKFALLGRPEFVKPNREEAEAWSGRTIDGPSSAKDTLETMVKAGAAAGAISLGSNGLIWRSAKGEVLFADAPQLSARSCVGSGDAALAGFAFASQQRLPAVEAVRLATACGSANCLAGAPGRARAADIASLKEQIRVEVLA